MKNTITHPQTNEPMAKKTHKACSLITALGMELISPHLLRILIIKCSKGAHEEEKPDNEECAVVVITYKQDKDKGREV